MASFEDIYDALWGLVDALGGPKKVGPRLRPGFDGADQWVRNCCNRDHAQNFHPHHVELLKQWGCESGYHDMKHWCDRNAGYAASAPLSMEAQIAALLKQAQRDRRHAEDSERNLRELAQNPAFAAWAEKTGVKVGDIA